MPIEQGQPITANDVQAMYRRPRVYSGGLYSTYSHGLFSSLYADLAGIAVATDHQYFVPVVFNEETELSSLGTYVPVAATIVGSGMHFGLYTFDVQTHEATLLHDVGYISTETTGYKLINTPGLTVEGEVYISFRQVGDAKLSASQAFAGEHFRGGEDRYPQPSYYKYMLKSLSDPMDETVIVQSNTVWIYGLYWEVA